MNTHGVNLERAGVPTDLARKFDVSEDVKFYASKDESRFAGLCKARNWYAAYKSGVGVTTGKIERPPERSACTRSGWQKSER